MTTIYKTNNGAARRVLLSTELPKEQAITRLFDQLQYFTGKCTMLDDNSFECRYGAGVISRYEAE